MVRTTVIAASLAIAFTSAQAAQPLSVKVYNADGSSFTVNSTLVVGDKEAMVIDAGFTRADALPIAPASSDSAKCTSSGSALSCATSCSPCERA